MNKRTLFLFAITILVVVVISLVGNIITIGDKATEIHPWLGAGFYILLGLFLLRFVLYPTLKFIFTPEFKGDERWRIDQMEEKELATYTKRLSMTASERALFAASATEQEGVRAVLTLRDEEANRVIRRTALNVFLVTGISQNGSFDIISALGMNVQMINSLVALRHQRPSITQLVELYTVILSAALLISVTDELLDEIDVSEIFGSMAGGLAKTLIASSLNGAMNAYLTLRVGKMTMKYLEMGSKYFKEHRKEIRSEARKSSLKEVPSIVKSGVESLTTTVKQSTFEKIANLNPLRKRGNSEPTATK